MRLKTSRRFPTALLLILALILASAAGCNKAKTHDAIQAAVQTDLTYPHIYATDDGRVIVANPTRALRRSSWYAMVPHAWPEGETRPVIGIGRLVDGPEGLHAVQIANVQADSLASLELIPVDGPQAIPNSKVIQRISAVEGNTLTIEMSRSSAVVHEDLYFILTRDRFSDEPRMGELLGAIARVSDIQENAVKLTVIHASDEIEVGDLAVFAEPSTAFAAPPLTIYAAKFGADAESLPAGELPAIMSAMPEFLARYGLSGISVEGIDAYVDPRPWDAALNAEAVTPDSDWGVIVFGDIENGRFLYNATGFGNAPEPDSSVGILAGGLPLAFESDLSELSEQLVPSFVANGLGMRGDHALAIYILENELRTREFDPLVRYHLREHLALRYNSLNAAAEALRIMNHDIAEATKKRETYPLLNALSIRAHLDASAGLIAQWAADSSRFIEVGEGVLPPDSLDAERTQLALAMLANGKIDEAERLASEVAERAKAKGDDRLAFSALLSLARVQLVREQPETALLILGELSEAAAAYPIERQVGLRMILAELYASLEMYQEAVDSLFLAFNQFQNVSYYTRASMLRRSAPIFDRIERKNEAARSIQDAAELYSYQQIIPEAAMTFAELAARKIGIAMESEPSLALRLLIEAREASDLSAILFLNLGQTLNAAAQLANRAWMDGQLRQFDVSDLNFDRAFMYAKASGAIEQMVNIRDAQARMRHHAGDAEAAHTLRQEAIRWAEFAGLEYDFLPFEEAPTN